jgi:hypothetical protein
MTTRQVALSAQEWAQVTGQECRAKRSESARKGHQSRQPRRLPPRSYKPAAFYVPVGTDLKQLLGRLHWYGAYLLNLIHMRTVWWRSDPDGFVRLKLAYLRKISTSAWKQVKGTQIIARQFDYLKEHLRQSLGASSTLATRKAKRS